MIRTASTPKVLLVAERRLGSDDTPVIRRFRLARLGRPPAVAARSAPSVLPGSGERQ
jgi:hypothetical protein